MDIARDTSQDIPTTSGPHAGGSSAGVDPDDGRGEAARSTTGTRSKLDRYSDEFANLVRQCPPFRTDDPSDWLARLPGEIFSYYRRGVVTFGQRAQTPAQCRGRLYLLHTALVLMWIEWGRQGARERLEAQAQEGTRRAAHLTILEAYRRGGVLAHYESSQWLSRPVGNWEVVLVREAISGAAGVDPAFREAVEQGPVVATDMGTLSALRDEGAIPTRDELVLG